MSRMTGTFTVGGADEIESLEFIDPKAQKALKAVLGQMDLAIFAANQEIIGPALPDLDQERMVRFAVVVAGQRAHYAREALRLSGLGREPDAEEIEGLARLRAAYEEMSAAFGALRRLVERGYTKMGRE